MTPPRGLSMSAMRKNEMDTTSGRTSIRLASASRTIADQNVAADGDQSHQSPGRRGNPVPPGSLGVSRRVQHIVHARNGQGDHGCRLRCSRGPERRPQLVLQLSSNCIDLPKLLLVAGPIEQDPLVEIFPEKRTHCRRQAAGRPGGILCRSRWPLPPCNSCADRSGLWPSKAESDDEAEQCQRSGQDNAEVFPHVFFQVSLHRRQIEDRAKEVCRSLQSIG
jgi:hypothetical protein